MLEEIQHPRSGNRLHDQLPKVREHILNWDPCVTQRLVAFNEYKHFFIYDQIFLQVKNSFFKTELHNWLIRDKMDIELSWFCPWLVPL